jgi:hypothetical protein
MWLFLSRRLRMWLILTVLVPLTSGVLRRVGRTIERRSGPNRISRALLGPATSATACAGDAGRDLHPEPPLRPNTPTTSREKRAEHR